MSDNQWGEGETRSDAAAARLLALIGRPEVSEAYIRFRVDLLSAQRAALGTLEPPAAVPMDRLPGGPLPIGPDDVAYPADVLARLFRAIRDAAATYGHATGELQRLDTAAAADPTLLGSLAAASAFGPDLETLELLARRSDAHPEALLFVGRAMAACCVAAAVRARGGLAAEAAAGGETAANRCPACTSVPSVARLRRADGHRILTCGLCGSEWEAARLVCACCGTSEHAALGVLRTSDADPRWLETCERCKGYIKTVDERRLPEGEPIFPAVEEAATLHLDLLAEREGYIRRVPYVLAG